MLLLTIWENQELAPAIAPREPIPLQNESRGSPRAPSRADPQTFGCDHMTSQPRLWTGFTQSVERFPERPALWVDSRELSYRELGELALRLAATIQAHPDFSPVPLTAVFGYRSPV